MRLICEYLNLIIEKYNHKDFFFIEIGAHDGVYIDPIYRFVTKHGWRGILVEPVPYLFKKLMQNYTGYTGLTFENAAISNTDDEREFYYLQKVIDGKDLSGVGSFDKDSWLKKKRKRCRNAEEKKWWIENVRPHFEKIYVPCLSYQSLLEKHSVKRLDLLQIDVEGYDFDIIKQIDFNNVRPQIIHYEHSHLGLDTEASWNFLQEHGYELTKVYDNTLAVSR